MLNLKGVIFALVLLGLATNGLSLMIDLVVGSLAADICSAPRFSLGSHKIHLMNYYIKILRDRMVTIRLRTRQLWDEPFPISSKRVG
jgi:hypothetical protein